MEEPSVGADAAVLRDAVEVTVGEQPLGQRAEGDDALAQPHRGLLEAVALDGAVKDGIAVLVDDKGHPELGQDGGRLFQRGTVVVGKSHIERLAAGHGLG